MSGFAEALGRAIASHVDITGLAEKLWDSIWPWAQKKLDENIPAIVEQLSTIVPLVAAAAGKAIADQFVKEFGHILQADPDIPVVSDIFDLSETIRSAINDSEIPIHIPVISDILKGFGGR